MAARQPEGIKRTDLQQHDLSVPGLEVVQTRVDFGPTALFVKHTHPGEEIIYVLEGSLEYQIEGQPTSTVTAGDVLFVPAGAVHAVRTSAAATPPSSPLTSSRRASPSSPLVE
jgi:quercetin dioxygenase-like cupin family protein